ncbi:uncharacterized protein PG998_011468 [Apiospora kogelbergensis]|uniref:uncharacterized protein n=1 Tax=Apiospora kogelbergensis TaxID=1337665 RepID=UPI00312D7CAC
MYENSNSSPATPSSSSSTNTGPRNASTNGDTPPARLFLFSHELPSGDVQDLFRRLHRYAKSPNYPFLARFLGTCVSLLREEVQKLPRRQRESVPPFSDVATLGSEWEHLRNGQLGGAWEGAFVCIYELGMLIGYHEGNKVLHNGDDRQALTASCLAGISIGLFSAAAVAVSQSLVDLVSFGAEAVRTAFVFCSHVGRVSQLLESTHDTKDQPKESDIGTWAAVITGLGAEVVQAELDHFNNEQDSGVENGAKTLLTRISISHVDQVSVGITGPPSRLTELFRRSLRLASSRHAALPISGGLCHVPNVYDDDDVRAILKAAQAEDRWGSRPVQRPLLSPYTGAAFEASNAHQLVRAICTEALTKPLFFDRLAEGAATHISHDLGSQTAQSCQILHYRTSSISETIVSTVNEKLSPEIMVQRQDLVDWLMAEESAMDQECGNPGVPQDSKLAIVGMACRMPSDADTPERFWELLVEGRDTLSVVPPDRFDIEAHFNPKGEIENTVGTKFGNFISNPGQFDAGFFNMSPREAQQTDPMQRLALITAYEALEMAGFVPNRTPSSHVTRVGTYYGQASDDYREVNASQKIGTYGIPGTERAFGNGRINYFFNFQGPSLNIDTACSSGLAAIHVACSALWAGEADTVVAGGLNVITNPDIYCMLSKGHFLSQTGQCKVWDAAADGYCRGDGIGSVVIKRLEDAVADNDVVLATILSANTNHSSESVSITQPHAGVQKSNYRHVLDRAGVNPLDVSFVELHGTGTQVGDAVESDSVVNFFAPPGHRRRPDQRLHLGALKSNIGHGEAAAGVASLIKVLLMYRHGTIPRHIGIKTALNPVVARHLAHRNAGVVFENTLGRPGGEEALLRHAPPPVPIEHSMDSGDGAGALTCEVVCLSAKSKASLRDNVNTFLRYLEEHPETRLKDIAYTTCARRMHHHIRLAKSVASTAQLRDFLREVTDELDAHAKHVSTAAPKSVVFAFSGQGGFYRGAAAALFRRAPEFRDMVLQLDRVVRKLGLPSVLAALTNDESGAEGSERAMSESPLVTQLALVVLQIGLAQYWELLGIVPDVVIGHSLGEYAAMCTAGVLSVADTLFLVGKRAELMISTCEVKCHVMLSIRGASPDRIAQLCRGSKKEYRYEISCINGLTDTVVSGIRADICALRDMLQEAAGFKCVLLDVPFAFHSAQMDPILDDFESAARFATFKVPKKPVISPLLGQCVTKGQIINEIYLRRATRETVDFVSGVNAAMTEGLINDDSIWVDIGPHPVCTAFVRNCQEHREVATQVFPSLKRADESLAAWSESLAALHSLGLPVAWNEYFLRREALHRLLPLDSYQWNKKDYWIPYEGTWTLNKANPAPPIGVQAGGNALSEASLFTSSVQKITFEDIGAQRARLTAVSNLFHPDLMGAASGHKINGRSVLTATIQSIWADICFTVGKEVHKRLAKKDVSLNLSVKDMEVLEAQVLPAGDLTTGSVPPQFIRIEALLDLSHGQTQVKMYAATADGILKADRAFATATVCYEDAQAWQAEWQTAAHLVASRIDAIWSAASGPLAAPGETMTSALSQSAAYQLFGNIVDYDARYRAMRRVALVEGALEATADVVLGADRHGTWHTPPHWIDGAFQLAGFVMNSFGWRQLRLAEPLEPGPEVQFRNYVRMVPVDGEAGAYSGDIYLLRGTRVVGVCAGIKFKRVPRAMMPIMFPRHEGKTKLSASQFSVNSQSRPVDTKPIVTCQQNVAPQADHLTSPPSSQVIPSSAPKASQDGRSPNVAACIQLIANETGLDMEDISGKAAFVELGVDSLMSLTLAERIQTELGIQVKASLFLECATVQDLENWLTKHSC